MRTSKRTFLVLAAVLLMVGVVPALAQDSRAPAPEPRIAQGQLLKVDTTARMIVIRSAQGAQMQFSYTEDTRWPVQTKALPVWRRCPART